MLVITRKVGQEIRIGEDITLMIVEIKGNSVRVGIQAPREVKILRTELPDKKPQPDPIKTGQP